MKLKPYLLSLLLFTSLMSFSQDEDKDPVAILILDKMGAVIGDLESCSYNLDTSYDTDDTEYGTEKHFNHNEVFMVGPGRMLVRVKGDTGHRGYWYNGQTLTYYSFDENNYAQVETPEDDIMATIDFIHTNYGIDFPGGDFFYPTFTDDLIENFNTIKFLGKKNVDNKECFHILATNEEMNVQIWIENGGYSLPQRFVISYKDNAQRQYMAAFSNWNINPNIPEAVFEFTPPPNAHEILIKPKS